MSTNFRESPTRQEKNFAIYIFATRSRYLTTPPTISRLEMMTPSVLHVFQRQNNSNMLAHLSKHVGRCQREGANSEDLFAVAVMTGELS